MNWTCSRHAGVLPALDVQEPLAERAVIDVSNSIVS